jgi:hypothetical protein
MISFEYYNQYTSRGEPKWTVVAKGVMKNSVAPDSILTNIYITINIHLIYIYAMNILL